NQYLSADRVVMQRVFGRPLDKIKITRVAVRNVTSTSGEALVEYDLPATVVGNDNWVHYTLHNGRWKVSDCHAPIGGSKISTSGTVTTRAITAARRSVPTRSETSRTPYLFVR